MATTTKTQPQVETAMAFIYAFNAHDFTAAYNESFLPTFPDLHFRANQVLVDGDSLVVQ